jgi:hypothetical protein
VGPRVGLDDLKKRKFLTRTPTRPACSQSLSRLLSRAYICVNVFKAIFLYEKHTDNKTRVTSINLVQLSGNDKRQKKGYFV